MKEDWKIDNLKFNNAISGNGFFYCSRDNLYRPEATVWLTGQIDHWNLIRSGVAIEYHRFKNEDGKVLTMETISTVLRQMEVVVQPEKNGKIKDVYIFGDVIGYNYLIGKIDRNSKFGKYALRVFRKFWSDGAGIMQLLNEIDHANS